MIADCAVMLASLAATNTGEDILVHFLHDDRVAAQDLIEMGALVTANGAAWAPLRVPAELAAKFPNTERYGYSAWYRVLLPELLAELDRVLYLDSDLLITDRLRELFDVPLAGACLAAVTQPTLPEVLPRLQNTLGLPDLDSYFNSGVMVLDLEQLRVRGSVADVLEFITEGRGPMPWADQDPLNAVLHGSRKRLGPRWNLMTPVFELPPERLPWGAAEISDAIASPAIVHFIGPYKPWHYRCRHPYRRQYFEYLAATPWAARAIEGRTLRNVIIKPWPAATQPRVERALDRLHRLFRSRHGTGS